MNFCVCCVLYEKELVAEFSGPFVVEHVLSVEFTIERAFIIITDQLVLPQMLMHTVQDELLILLGTLQDDLLIISYLCWIISFFVL